MTSIKIHVSFEIKYQNELHQNLKKMSSEEERRDKKRKKKERKAEKKERKKEKKSRKRERSPSPEKVVSVEKPAAAVVAPDLSKMSADEKRKLLGAARAARNKTAYSGAELGDTQQSTKFKRFLGLDKQSGNAPVDAGSRVTPGLEQQLAAQYEKGRQYQFGKRVLGSKQ